ncbi:MAG TPA: T9SS type A sorting domain-containing protein [Ignavibacteria bacterium]|nr:T9SS type A sorting domain-containing protein [Ignavibacteria bacterium]
MSFLNLSAQTTDRHGCDFTEVSPLITGPFKPLVTPNSFMRILVVYVQFSNEAIEPSHSDWPAGDPPDYFGELLAEEEDHRTDWWNAYSTSTESISSWFCEVSRGQLHIIGKEYNIVLDYDSSHYQNANGESEVNKEIYDKLTELLQDGDWSPYDNWTLNPTTQTFTNSPDGKIDMIYKIHRHRYSGIFSEHPASGYALLGKADGQWEYEVDPINQKSVLGGFPEYTTGQTDGSGLTLMGNATEKILSKSGVMGRLHHEHGHYFFGVNHSTYGKMGGGGDFFFDPWERIKLGYITPYISEHDDYDGDIVVLDDYSARTGGNHLLVVELPYSEMIIANRRGISPWDVTMIGDTNAFRETPHPEYGRGIYIYHNVGYNYPNSSIDIECADGIWKWEQNGHWAPDWDPYNAWLPVLTRTEVVYDRSDNGSPEATTNGSVAWGKDDLNILGLTPDNPPKHQGKWFSTGKDGSQGTDRLYTNELENWTSRSLIGDRWDAWDVGYNEVFSPYSSPNTRSWANHQTGVFIWVSDYNSSTKQATIKIYREQDPLGQGQDLLDILEATPPSKPMGIKEEECVYSNGHFRPKISWNHNMEPDMIRGGGLLPENKRYKIYRSTADDMTEVPPDAFRNPENVYSHIATVDIPPNTNPTFIDDEIISGCALPDGPCPPNCWILYPVRYRIQAVDKYDDVSVLSDFANTTAIRTVSGDPGGEEEGGDNTGYDGQVPTAFNLFQNYPNPFNPTTNIQYDIPKDVLVSIKIYDMLGREVADLVNEFKNAGRYIVGFNGSNLSSGIYYYKIKAGNFEQTRRMVLIK